MVKELKDGKYYKWIGPYTIKNHNNWNRKGYMDEILDGKPRKFIAKKLNYDDNPGNYGKFEKCSSPSNYDDAWYWGDFLEYFKEVPYGLSKKIQVLQKLIN